MLVADILAQHVVVSSGNLPAVSVDSVAFDNFFERLNVYSNFDYWVK